MLFINPLPGLLLADEGFLEEVDNGLLCRLPPVLGLVMAEAALLLEMLFSSRPAMSSSILQTAETQLSRLPGDHENINRK